MLKIKTTTLVFLLTTQNHYILCFVNIMLLWTDFERFNKFSFLFPFTGLYVHADLFDSLHKQLKNKTTDDMIWSYLHRPTDYITLWIV